MPIYVSSSQKLPLSVLSRIYNIRFRKVKLFFGVSGATRDAVLTGFVFNEGSARFFIRDYHPNRVGARIPTPRPDRGDVPWNKTFGQGWVSPWE